MSRVVHNKLHRTAAGVPCLHITFALSIKYHPHVLGNGATSTTLLALLCLESRTA